MHAPRAYAAKDPDAAPSCLSGDLVSLTPPCLAEDRPRNTGSPLTCWHTTPRSRNATLLPRTLCPSRCLNRPTPYGYAATHYRTAPGRPAPLLSPPSTRPCTPRTTTRWF
eukprot:scaffold76255_cov75-Phaeocystis_antarctica.AAC.2